MPPSKITIGLIYAEWCGHCSSFKPIWENISNKIKKNHNNITIRDINHTEEKLEASNVEFMKIHNIQVNGYPTIYKISRNNVIYFSGERKPYNIYSWIFNNIRKKKILNDNNHTQKRIFNKFGQRVQGGKKKYTVKRGLKKDACGCNGSGKTKKWFKWF